jgi:hypothetical protein
MLSYIFRLDYTVSEQKYQQQILFLGRVMNMINLDIRQAIAKKRLRHYEVAHALGISEFTLSRKLRQELSNDSR